MRLQKILIVDDESGIVKMLETILRKEGYTSISSAFTGQEAMEKISRNPYDRIVLDVMLPVRTDSIVSGNTAAYRCSHIVSYRPFR